MVGHYFQIHGIWYVSLCVKSFLPSCQPLFGTVSYLNCLSDSPDSLLSSPISSLEHNQVITVYKDISLKDCLLEHLN